MNKPFAIVTGASAGIGLELAAICAQEGLRPAGGCRSTRDSERG